MYYKFFGLAEPPFNITPDSRFLFLSRRHREALSALLYGVRERKGFILLTGEIGAGKTTVCRALVNELKAEHVRIALILNPRLSALEMLKAINDEFQIPSFYDTKKGLVDELNRFLLGETRKGGNVVLVIDESQNLATDVLEEIRMLSNLETEREKLLQIVLMGQPELNDTLLLPELEQLNQRITVRYHITPLEENELPAYIRHRLFVARAKVDVEFTEGALRLLYDATGGVPRKLNVICDRALLACYVESTYTVDERIMQKAISEVSAQTPASVGSIRQPGRRGSGRNILTSKFFITAAAAAAFLILISGAVAVGLRLANLSGLERLSPRPAPELAQGAGLNGGGAGSLELPDPELADAMPAPAPPAEPTPAPAAEPTPAPDWEAIRRKNPNWAWDRNAPLVRVNSPRSARRAAEFSMLRLWGTTVDLSQMGRLSEEQLVGFRIARQKPYTRVFDLAGTYYDLIRLNVPFIVRMQNPAENQSEFVVLLKAEGEAVTVGDPVWGVQTYRTQEFIKRWNGATGMLIDHADLKSLQRGDKTERVKQLQQALIDAGFMDATTGVFDVKTTDAIKKLQSYYKLPETGQMDDVTLMILNSLMMPKAPRLSRAGNR